MLLIINCWSFSDCDIKLSLLLPLLLVVLSHHVQSSLSLPSQPLSSCSDEFHKECHCGTPAMPPSTSLFTRIVYPNSTIKVEQYNESISYGYAKYLRVYYKCSDDSDVLVGNNMRECSKGNWLGLVPRCAINNLNQTHLSYIKISDVKVIDANKNFNELKDKPINVLIYYDESLQLDPSGTFKVPLENQPHDCLRWSLSPKQIWTLNLAKKTLVHYFRLKLYGNHIEDLYLNQEIGIELSLKNVSSNGLQLSSNITNQHLDSLPIEIKCVDTIPKESQFSTYHQKYSANYLVLDFLCEIEDKERSLFEFLFAEDFEIDELLVNSIEVRFEMFNVLHMDNSYGSPRQNIDLEFKQKIFVISLCELQVYSFKQDCGTPDLPVTAIVQRDFNYIENNGHGRKSYKYTCPYNQEMKEKPNIECGYYGKWKTEFPKCEHSSPCELLINLTFAPGYLVDVKYETMNKKYKDVVVPSGKFATITCIQLNDKENTDLLFSEKSSSNVTTSIQNNENNDDTYSYVSSQRRDVSQVKCFNGKWTGLDSVNCITHNSPDRNSVGKNLTDNKFNKTQVVSLPIRVIEILFVLFIILLLIIIFLLIYMIIFRKRMSNQVKKNFKEPMAQFGPFSDEIHNGMLGVPTINFESTEYAKYNSVDDLYERITLAEIDSQHVYHTIATTNHNQNHYSDLSLYPYSSRKCYINYRTHTLNMNLDAGEERYNSIYGLEEDGISDGNQNQQEQETTDQKESKRNNSLCLHANNPHDSDEYNTLSKSFSEYLKNN